MGSFIVFEGLDGAGKSTQVELLTQRFKERNIDYRYIHFPRTDRGIYGDLVARFLRGDFGAIDAIDPYLVSLLYAGDRDDAKEEITTWLDEGLWVILDRYVYSNIAYQCAKTPDPGAKKKLQEWILRLEYEHNKIPAPTISLYLDAPLAFVEKKLTSQRTGLERDYLQGKKDIHEADISFQEKVALEYRRISDEKNDLVTIPCFEMETHAMLSSTTIHTAILEALTAREIIGF